MERFNTVNVDDELLASMEQKARDDAAACGEFAERCLTSDGQPSPERKDEHHFWHSQEEKRLEDAKRIAELRAIAPDTPVV
jgi:hypothetical protein